MKLTFFLVITLSGVAFCAPQNEVQPAMSDEAVIASIDEVIADITEPLSSKFRNRDFFQGYVLKAIQHIKKECILSSYKKHSSVDMIPSAQNLRKFATKKEEIKTKITFLATLISCYRKGEVILEYVFESFMTNGIIIRAFIDEPAFKEPADIVACANYYAVKNHLWNPKEYNFTPKPVRDEDMCDEMTAMGDLIFIQTVQEGYSSVFAEEYNKKCYRGVALKLKEFIVKTVMLLQVEMTDDKKREEREHFVKDFYVMIEDFVSCNSIPAPFEH